MLKRFVHVIYEVVGKTINVIVNLLASAISLLVPKSDNILLFGSWFGKSFADNSKYLYLYCSYNKEELGLNKVLWITDSDYVYNDLKGKNLDVYKKWSLSGIWYHYRSGYHFICQQANDINAYFSVRSKRVQLWHGVGFKNISAIDEIPNKNSIKYKLSYFIKFITTRGFWYKFIFLSTSQFATEKIFNLSFRVWENKFIEGNYPRNIFLNEKDDKKYLDNRQAKLIEEIRVIKDKGYKIAFYLPTYRNNAYLDKNGRKIYPLNIDSEEEFDEFDKFLGKNKIYFLSKFHFAGNSCLIDEKKNFKNLPMDLDVYPILKCTDILITDYSSIYADFLFLDKPVIFYPYDLDKYKNQDKGFIFDFDQVTPGEKAFDVESLKSKMIYCLKNDDFKSERDKIKKLYFGNNTEDSFYSLLQKIRSEDI